MDRIGMKKLVDDWKLSEEGGALMKTVCQVVIR